MKKLVLILLVLVSVTGYTLKAQDVYSDNKMSVAFFSSTPVEDIDAHSALGSAAMNVKTKQVFVTVAMKSFQFKKELMQEHFNENYVESDKYPDATFNGTIKDNVDLTKNGTYNVTVAGKLTIHGVTKDRDIPVTITVSGKTIKVHSEFMVHIADHKIDVPTLVVTHIAEDVKVTVDGALVPYSG